jgi:hypothetical protein
MHAEICQRVANFIELERLDNRGNDFHLPILCFDPAGDEGSSPALGRERRATTRPQEGAFKCRASLPKSLQNRRLALEQEELALFASRSPI